MKPKRSDPIRILWSRWQQAAVSRTTFTSLISLAVMEAYRHRTLKSMQTWRLRSSSLAKHAMRMMKAYAHFGDVHLMSGLSALCLHASDGRRRKAAMAAVVRFLRSPHIQAMRHCFRLWRKGYSRYAQRCFSRRLQAARETLVSARKEAADRHPQLLKGFRRWWQGAARQRLRATLVSERRAHAAKEARVSEAAEEVVAAAERAKADLEERMNQKNINRVETIVDVMQKGYGRLVGDALRGEMPAADAWTLVHKNSGYYQSSWKEGWTLANKHLKHRHEVELEESERRVLELVEDADKVEKFVIKMKKLQPKPPPVEARFKTPPRGIRRNTHNGSALPVRGIANGEWLY